MFYLHTSNKTENLLAHLDTVLKNSGKDSILEKEIFLIQSEGMGRWLMQQMAIRNTLFCNYEFIFPNRFFERIAKIVGSHLLDEDFDRTNLLWRIYAILSNIDVSRFQTLRNYIEHDESGIKKFQLSQQLANLYDQYQISRPEMLFSWQNGALLFQGSQYQETELWQQVIWVEILKQLHGDIKSRTELWQDAIQKILHYSKPDDFPKTLSVFGINTLPEIYLRFLEALANHIDVHLYLLNPSQAYWADIPSKKQIALENLTKDFDDQIDLLELGHPLLSNFGKQGQYFQELLLLEEKIFQSHFESFALSEGSLLLEHLQNDLLLNQLSTLDKCKVDNSIQIHNCHTAIRELEVLKNEILYVVDQENINLRDIVIMAPNIEDYAPYIPAIFADIKHTLADESLRNANPLIDAFEQFLTVITGRFGWQEVLDLLAVPELQTHFNIDEADLEQIAYWVEQSNIRWGYSGIHKKELGLPEDHLNTWLFGLQRMMMGYAIGDDTDLFNGIAPYVEIEGQSAILLGKLYQFINYLINARQTISESHSLPEWVELLSRYVSELFSDDSVPSYYKVELSTKLSALDNEALSFFKTKVDFRVILNWFQSQNAEASSAQGFLTGGLTFCSMLPMRSIPFKVIALLGMNEGAFPGVDRKNTFDLTQVKFRKGDRSKRLDNKYQFLETILSARGKLWIFYQGQLAETNEAVQPSSAVCDLVDILTEYYGLSTQDLMTKHPLQSYHKNYFVGNKRYKNYNLFQCEIARRLQESQIQGSRIQKPLWWSRGDRLLLEWSESVEIDDLIQFVKNPQKYFVRNILQLRLNTLEDVVDEKEPFSISGLENYSLTQTLIETVCHVELVEPERLYEQYKAKGVLLGGAVGRHNFESYLQKASNYKTVYKQICLDAGEKIDDTIIEQQVGLDAQTCVKISGVLGNQHKNAQVIFRVGELDGKTFLAVWIQHLVLNTVQPKKTYLIYGKDQIQCKVFQPEHVELSPLSEWLAWFQKGQQQPSTLITEPAFSYVLQLHTSRSKKSPGEMALETLVAEIDKNHQPELRLLCRNFSQSELNELLNDSFQQICERLIDPIWSALL